MVAVIQVLELTGAGPTPTTRTWNAVTFRNIESAVSSSSNPLVIPSSGREYSYAKAFRLEVSGAFTAAVTDLRAYSSGSNPFGGLRKMWYSTAGSYTQPAVPSESNDPPQFPGTTAMADFFGTSVASPISLGAGPFDDTGTPKQIGSYLYLVAELEPGAMLGVWPEALVVFGWDGGT